MLLSKASAGEQRCIECCQRSGLASCPTRIRVYGEGSEQVREGAVWRVIGVWWLDCERGAAFEPGATVVLDHSPADGEVLRLASPPETIRCYAQSCGVPPGACIVEDGDVFTLRNCADAQPLSAADLSRGFIPAAHVPTGTAQTAIAPLPAPTGSITVPLRLPDPPEDRCETSESVVEEARRRVNIGDISRAQNRLDEAIPEYMAALAMDRCSAAAWTALGHAALQGDRPAEAIRSLQIATRISPQHYPAYTALGQALERLGQPDRAATAYGQALSIKPDYPPATDGLARVGGGLSR